jgi:transcriptional regulator with XRE-family HTH domain
MDSHRAERLRQLRRDHSLTAAEIAAFLSVSRRRVWQWLAGDVEVPAAMLTELEVRLASR